MSKEGIKAFKDMTFKDLMNYDVKPYLKKRDGLDYLPWATCVQLLHELGAEKVYFEPVTNENGSSLLMSDQVFTDSKGNSNRCYETRIRIVVDDKEFFMQVPIMNGVSPVRDNSMSQQRVWNTMTRAFVKGVALHLGLGFSLWAKDENKEFEEDKPEVYHDIMQVRERVFEKVTQLNKMDLTLADIANEMDRSEDEIKQFLNQYKILFAFEKNLDHLIANNGKRNDKK